MSNGNPSRRLSRLEVLLTVFLVAVIVLFVFLVSQFRQQRPEHARPAGNASTGPDARSAEFDPENDGGSRGENGTSAALASSEFSEKSLAIVLPDNGAATNLADAGLAGNSADGIAGRTSTNQAAKEAKRLTATAGDIQAELQRIAGLPWGPDTEKQLQTALAQWAATDPDAALAYAMNLESRRAGTAAVSSILNQWAQRDPAAAYEWFKQNLAGNPQMVSAALTGLFDKMAAVDPDMALRNVWQLPQDLRNRALQATVNQMIASGKQEQIMQYFNTLNDSSAQSMLATIFVNQWATYYPAETASWIASLTDPAVRYRATLTLISKWGYDNPAAAVDWVASLPRDQNWGAEVSRMMDVWAKDAPDKAADWLLTLFPASAQLDPAIQSLVNTVMNTNPEGAMMWSETITDTNKRYSLMQKVAAIWMKKDPERAAIYITNSDLPNSIKKKLFRMR